MKINCHSADEFQLNEGQDPLDIEGRFTDLNPAKSKILHFRLQSN
jgi:hypothetical protein